MDKVVDSNQIQAVIMVTKGSDSAIVARLDGSSLLVGRELPADLVIDNQFVSRRHFLITPGSNGYLISDEGSKNGTTVNDTPVGSTPTPLANGDLIRIANGQVEMRYQVSSATATIRSPGTSAPEVLTSSSSDLKVDLISRTVAVGGETLNPPLVGRQFSLLACLFEAGGRACGWEELHRAGWPDRDSGMVGRNEVVQAIHEVRKRLSIAGSSAEIASVRGFGYRLDA